jgi:hypothetical protein
MQLPATAAERMKYFFIPGPLLLGGAGLSGVLVSSDYLWIPVAAAAIAIPFTLIFIAASFREFWQLLKEK